MNTAVFAKDLAFTAFLTVTMLVTVPVAEAAKDVSQLEAQINQETQDRIAADSELGNLIDLEKQARTAADSDLNFKIEIEIQNRILDVNVEKNERIIADDDEESARISADIAEQNARITADGELANIVDVEKQNRLAEDTRLEFLIDIERTTRTAEIEGLQVQIDNLTQAEGHGVLPANVRSFFASLTETMSTAELIASGQPDHFMLTDLAFDTTGAGDPVPEPIAVELMNSGTILGRFRVLPDTLGHGHRQLTFESGIPVDTTSGALGVSVISGMGGVDVVVSGYYFAP